MSDYTPTPEAQSLSKFLTMKGQVFQPPQVTQPPLITRPKGFTGREHRDAQTPAEYLSGGLVQHGMLTLLSGPAKARKSFLLMDLAVALGGGGAWLNHETKEPVKVLFLDLEIDPSFLEKRFDRLYIAHGANGVRARDNVMVLPWRGVLDNPAESMETVISAVAAEAEAFGAQVVVLDSIYLLLKGRESDPACVETFLATVRRTLCTKAAVVMSHHFTKGNASQQNDKSAQDRASGTSYWSRFPDVLIPFTPPANPPDDERVLLQVEPVVRHHQAPSPYFIEWRENTLRFHVVSGEEAEAIEEAASETKAQREKRERQEEQARDDAESVFEKVRERNPGGWVSRSAVPTQCARVAPANRVFRAVEVLVSDERFRETKNGGRVGYAFEALVVDTEADSALLFDKLKEKHPVGWVAVGEAKTLSSLFVNKQGFDLALQFLLKSNRLFKETREGVKGYAFTPPGEETS